MIMAREWTVNLEKIIKKFSLFLKFIDPIQFNIIFQIYFHKKNFIKLRLPNL